MKSTDNNLNNNNLVNDISDLTDEMIERILPISRDIKNYEEYLIGYKEDIDEYVLYKNIYFSGKFTMFPLYTYKNPQDAIDRLRTLKKTKTDNPVILQIESILLNYIGAVHNTHEALISLISIGGYKDSPKLQYLIEYPEQFGLDDHSAHGLAKYMVALLHNAVGNIKRDRNSNNELLILYSALYDEFVKYDFFEHDDKYLQDEPDIADEAKDIYKVIANYNNGLLQ